MVYNGITVKEDNKTKKEITKMANNDLMMKVEQLNELEEMMDELNKAANAIRESIKAEMDARNVEELNLGKFIVRWTSVLSTRFDTKRFKQVFGEELYKAYTKEVASRRFSVSC